MSTFNVSRTAFLHSSVVYQPVDFMSGAGGCMHLNTSAAASFAHCRFAHCSSPLTGGGVSFFQGEVKPQFLNTTFEFNEALIQGGAIELVMMNGPANFTDCSFRSNRVTNGPSFGVAILSFGVPMRVEMSYFWRNVAVNTLPPGSQAATYLTQGGAIAANMFMDATVPYDIIDCTFVENQRSYFRRNVAVNTLPPGSQAATYLTQGGAIAANMPGKAELWRARRGSVCGRRASASAQLPLPPLCLASVSPIAPSVSHATQGGQGGALYIDTGHLQVLNCLFLRNGDHSECSLGGASESHSPASVVLVRGPGTHTPQQLHVESLRCTPLPCPRPSPSRPYTQQKHKPSRSCFQGNSVLKQNGEAIQVLKGTGAVRVESSTFVGNRAEQSKGGALYSESVSVTFDNVTLDGNKAALQGGAVAGALYSESVSMTFDSVTLDGNTAGLQGGAVAVYASSSDGLPTEALFKSCCFVRNEAVLGGVYASSSDGLPTKALFTSCRFVRNEAVLGGGAIYTGLGMHTRVHACEVEENNSTGLGGAVLVQEFSRVEMTRTRCQRNMAGRCCARTGVLTGRDDSHAVSGEHVSGMTQGHSPHRALTGGACLSLLANAHATVTDSVLSANHATSEGGGGTVCAAVTTILCFLSSRPNLPHQSPDRRALTGGACLSLLANAHATVTDSILSANHGTSEGGAALALTGGACLSLLANAHATVTDSILSANHGTSEGGAARVSGSAHLSLLSSSVSHNTAAWGGAVWVEMGASLLISNNSKLVGNEARYLGGTVYATHVSRVEVRGGSVFRGNSALHGGAMVVEAEARVTAADSAFENNTFSGILFQGFSQGVLRNCSFTRNSNAAGRGGAVLVGDKTTVAVHSCSFAGNWAALGGAVSTEGSPYLIINGSDFTRNIAQIGAGVALAGSTAFTMGESVFIKNNATKAGGGVAVLEQVEGEISGSRFEGNYAVVGGAGVYLMRSAAATAAAAGGGNRPPRVRLQGLLFDGNSAMDAHGVAFFDASYSPHLRSACHACQMRQQGDTQGSMPADFYLQWPGVAASSQETGGSFSVVGSVGSMLTGLQVVVVDEFGNIVSKDNSALSHSCQGKSGAAATNPFASPDPLPSPSHPPRQDNSALASDNSALASVSPDSRISGSLRGTSQGGIITVPPIAVRVSPGGALQPIALTVTVSSTTNAFPDFSHPFNISFCPAGQYFDGESFSCQDCPVGHWAWRHVHTAPSPSFQSNVAAEGIPVGHIPPIITLTKSLFPSSFSPPSHYPILLLSGAHRARAWKRVQAAPSPSSPTPPQCNQVTIPVVRPPSLTPPPRPPSLTSPQGMETCPDGTFTFYPNAVSQEQCTPCDDDSLDCRYGTLELGLPLWLEVGVCVRGVRRSMAQHGTFMFFPNAVSQQQCMPCDDDSLDCRYGMLEEQCTSCDDDSLDCRYGTLEVGGLQWAAAETPLTVASPLQAAAETPLTVASPLQAAAETPLTVASPLQAAAETPLTVASPLQAAAETPLTVASPLQAAAETPLTVASPLQAAAETPLTVASPLQAAAETPLTVEQQPPRPPDLPRLVSDNTTNASRLTTYAEEVATHTRLVDTHKAALAAHTTAAALQAQPAASAAAAAVAAAAAAAAAAADAPGVPGPSAYAAAVPGATASPGIPGSPPPPLSSPATAAPSSAAAIPWLPLCPPQCL
ncbi:unnamed protein product [Closterium sp. Naga37s-1]|nr:unnamed protein product [Closterium sp. Naga37s-1]